MQAPAAWSAWGSPVVPGSVSWWVCWSCCRRCWSVAALWC